MNVPSAQARRPDWHDVPSRGTVVGDLADRLQALLPRIMRQARHGWDINVILQLNAELGELVDACERHDQPQAGEQLLAVKTALAPAVTGLRLPDAGATTLITALTAHLRTLVPDLRMPAGSHDGVEASTGAQRVLIASLQQQRARDTAALLTKAGFEVRVLDEPLATLEQLSRYTPQCIVLDRRMPLYDGAELAEMIHERADFADVPVLLIDDEDDGEPDETVLPASALAAQLVARVQQRIDASASAKPTELNPQHGTCQRAALLDCMGVALHQGTARTISGLLVISIDHADALQEHHGLSTLTIMHRQLGALLASMLDSSDMLAENGTGYLLLSRMRDASHLRALADELRTTVRHERYGPSALPITITIGGCHFDGGPDTVDAVLSAAQRANANASAGAIGWYRPARDQVGPAQLQAALDQGRLHMVFQAIVRSDSNPTPQYQALLRMRDADGYVRHAAELLPIAKHAGLSATIDSWALDYALELLATYQRQTRPLRLFVNQTRASLLRHGYAIWLNERLRAHGVSGARLVLTFECADVNDAPGELFTATARVRALGVGLCLAGIDRKPQSTALLDTLPLEYIKLAPQLADHPGALVPMAHARNIAVIASRIEERTVVEQLRKLGVDYIQGHALAHPSPTLNYAFDAAAN